MKVLITGADGFIGKNLIAHLRERDDVEILCFTRQEHVSVLKDAVAKVDWIFHFAGVNRPRDVREFQSGNVDLTCELCAAVLAAGRHVPVVYTSSSQAALSNPYGDSKRAAENALLEFSASHGSSVHLFRLPNVFGKWARPNYNSVVATFCYNITRNLPITISNPDAEINLVYIDDVVRSFVSLMDGEQPADPFLEVAPQYRITVGKLAEQLYAFRDSRASLVTEPVGTGMVRALHSTYLSYVPPESFTYRIPKFSDPRGVFVEMLKTKDSGQFSFFTAHPGVTRGGHYHHSKTEKFLVIKGRARFRFRHIVTGEFHEVVTHGDVPEIVETVPGWTHDVTNVGDDEMVAMLWANEIFDRSCPDTYARPVDCKYRP